ncbi:MAG: N(4)-(beta-N-acetylglucosaminyl)-L-asparaginase [Acidobacteria bacterium]|nr:N(4)-(beta-N-acetylglucosaminyl)-L-asparaginase [Acidobacteriota bacterium]
MLTAQGTTPMVISDYSGFGYRNGGTMNAVEKAFQMISEGEDVLDALIAGVNIAENDPTEIGIGYGGLPNERGVVQLDSCCMHGPKKRAGGVAALEGVRTPSLVAKAVADYTDHHLLVGQGAQDFARNMGFEIEDDLNTDRSRELWLEWRQRVDPEHYLDPNDRPLRKREAGGVRGEVGGIKKTANGATRGINKPARQPGQTRALEQARTHQRDLAWRGYQAGLDMVREGLIPEHSFWGTINCNGINAAGEICGVTTTSGLSWKIPGRAGDSPILGAGLYVDGDVGACGSTGRGEANLFNLSSFLIVEKMRDGMHPKDAALEGLRRIRANTIEERLLNSRGEPAFNVRFFVLDKQGRYAGVQMYGGGEGFAICTENGAELIDFDYLLEGSPDE